MRGNETQATAGVDERVGRFSIPMRGNERRVLEVDVLNERQVFDPHEG